MRRRGDEAVSKTDPSYPMRKGADHMKIWNSAVGRRTQAFTALFIAALALSACSGNTGGTGVETPGADAGDRPAWCGEEADDIVVGVTDGFGGNTARQIFNAVVQEELNLCPAVTDVIYSNGQGDPQKTIAGIDSLVAQGVDIILGVADFGEAELPAVQAATDAGVTVVFYAADPGGDPGEDYFASVKFDLEDMGRQQAQWLAEQIGGEGDVLFVGGFENNNFTNGIFEGFQAELAANYPDVTILEDGYLAANWDPAMIQQMTAAMLAKYPQIDGIANDFGGGTLSAARAFEAAGRPFVPVTATSTDNLFNCSVPDIQAANPDFQAEALEGNWRQPQYGVRVAVAEVTGGDPGPFEGEKLVQFYDTSAGDVPPCDPELPDGAYMDTDLTKEQLLEYLQ